MFCNNGKNLICVLLLLSICLCACEKQEESAPQMETYNNLDNALKKEIFIEKDSNLQAPMGLVCVDDSIYVISKENNCVLRYSTAGEFEAVFGNIGKKEGEFSKPTAIANYEETIYIADENDGRIQAFDLEGNFQKEFYIENLNNRYISVLDIESDKDFLYLSVAGAEKKALYIYILDKDTGKVEKIEKSCMGALGKDEKQQIYFAQAYVYFEEKGSIGYEGGESYVARISENKMAKIFQLPDKYAPADILVNNNQIFIFSGALTQVDVFELDGTYVQTLFYETSSAENRGLGFMTMDAQGNIYLSDSENHSIYKLERKH